MIGDNQLEDLSVFNWSAPLDFTAIGCLPLMITQRPPFENSEKNEEKIPVKHYRYDVKVDGGIHF
jgi:hypothetical protein